ncbi:3-oxoacyl-ACP reductase FabG [Candidatus Babeliales bacterium]|nr:3-oxoacyl-ACP reductase FabG [Candidatus Babeliales bacterium]MCF7899258.1 3-oxoacyl-ACP reductase FabG [Candidatus Babeliales bacterium]
MNKKNIIVTGGVQGIGRAIVQKFLDNKDQVFVFDYIDINNQIVMDLQNAGAQYFCVDIANIESIKNGFEQVYNILQNQNLDILVNNAGITKDNLAIRMSEQDWDSVFAVNSKGTFFCCQQAIKRMMKQNKSYIINISSIVALSGNAGQANYAASKAAVISMTKSLAQEYGSRNIMINAISPGFIQTQMTDKLSEKIKENVLNRISLKRFGTPQDVGNLVYFLTGGQADYITGSVIDINGGLI